MYDSNRERKHVKDRNQKRDTGKGTCKLNSALCSSNRVFPCSEYIAYIRGNRQLCTDDVSVHIRIRDSLSAQEPHETYRETAFPNDKRKEFSSSDKSSVDSIYAAACTCASYRVHLYNNTAAFRQHINICVKPSFIYGKCRSLHKKPHRLSRF